MWLPMEPPWLPKNVAGCLLNCIPLIANISGCCLRQVSTVSGVNESRTVFSRDMSDEGEGSGFVETTSGPEGDKVKHTAPKNKNLKLNQVKLQNCLILSLIDSPFQLYMCTQCGKTYKTHRWMVFHIAGHLTPRTKNFKCRECDKYFRDNEAVSHHVMRHHRNKRTVKCLDCGLKFFTKSNMLEHSRTVHVVRKMLRTRSKGTPCVLFVSNFTQ